MAKGQFVQRFGNAARLGVAAVCGLSLMTLPVLAQFGRQGGGMFDSFFGPFSAPRYAPSERSQDFTRAPAQRKPDNQPGASVLVFGNSMADWLAYGLEDALGDTPELGVVRKNRSSSGLIRYDQRNESQDWPQVIREAIAQAKPKFVVMMLGLNDRQSMRERPLPSGAAAAAAATTAPPLVPQGGAATPAAPDAADAERAPPDHAPGASSEQSKPAAGYRTYEFRTEEWAEFYARKIDAAIVALKSSGVPVFWVGLPSIRGPKSTSDMLYLNDLFRTRAEKAGVNYIDVWDGFVDENGRFAVQGPDFEGQIRRLRVSDGVHFTKAGARKVAHYLEREIRRVMTRGTDLVALPSAEPALQTPAPRPGAPTARPLAGPVVPLNVSAKAGQDLLGVSEAVAAINPRSVNRVLVNGEAVAPPAGRSDDFKWPRRGVAAFGTDPVVATTTDPVPVVAAASPIAPAPAPEVKAADVKSSKKTNGRGGQSQQRTRRTTTSGGLPFIR